MSKCDSQTLLANQSWLSHTQAASKTAGVRPWSSAQSAHTQLFVLGPSTSCVWHCVNQPHTNPSPSPGLPDTRTHLTTSRQAGSHSGAAATYTGDSKGDRGPRTVTISYETETAISHRFISLTGILVSPKRTNCCWIFLHSQDIVNVIKSLQMPRSGSEWPLTQTARPSSPAACPQLYLLAERVSKTRGHAPTSPTSLQLHPPQGIPCALTVFHPQWISFAYLLSLPSTHKNCLHPQNPLKRNSMNLWLIPSGLSYFCLLSVWLPASFDGPNFCILYVPIKYFVLGHTRILPSLSHYLTSPSEWRPPA